MQRAYSFAKRPPGQAAAALRTGKALYAAGDRMGALKAFEAALAKLEPTATVSDVRMELLYSAACCHAAFGDIEMALMNLRGAHPPSPHTLARNPKQPLASSTSWALARLADSLEMGLDYDTVQSGSNPEFMRMEVSAQMRKQLQKFSEGKIKSSGTVAREAFEKSRAQARAEGGPTLRGVAPPPPSPTCVPIQPRGPGDSCVLAHEWLCSAAGRRAEGLRRQKLCAQGRGGGRGRLVWRRAPAGRPPCRSLRAAA